MARNEHDIFDPDSLGYVDTRYFIEHCVGCEPCKIVLARPSKDEAVTAWNARSERTCENLLDDHSCDFECSACGFSVSTFPDEGTDWHTPFWSYCPNCGAKVAPC